MQTPTAKFQPTHGVVGNAPVVFSLVADLPVVAQRVFTGSGAPSGTTLNAGNGKFCGLNSGWVVAASAGAAGAGYAAGDVLTAVGGTFSIATGITVDSVNAAGGILDFHVSTAGNYSAYPANSVGVTGGSGSGATFNLALQPADTYYDFSNIASPNFWVCTVSGSNSSSTWFNLSGCPT